MKRFSRKWFTQIMIHRLLKKELDSLKRIIKEETNVNYNLSYGDVITFLVNHYKKSNRIEYPIEEQTRVAIALQKISSSIVTKTENKTRVVNSLES